MIKLIVSDLDGTLIINHQEVVQSEVDAIKKWMAMGHDFAIASGRNIGVTHELEKKHNLHIVNMVGGSGSVVFIQRQPIVVNEISKEIFLKLYHMLQPYQAELDYSIDTLSNENYMLKAEGAYFKKFGYRKAQAPVIADEYVAQGCPHLPNKIFIMLSDAQRQPFFAKMLHDAFDDVLTITTSSPEYFEVCPKGADKGSGLKILAEHLHLTMDEIAAIGDEGNDMPMLKIAGTSFAMNSGRESVKAACDYVVGSVSEMIEKCIELNQK